MRVVCSRLIDFTVFLKGAIKGRGRCEMEQGGASAGGATADGVGSERNGKQASDPVHCPTTA